MRKIPCAIIVILLTGISSMEAKNFEFLSFVDYYGGIEPVDGYQNLRNRIFMRPTFYGEEKNSGFKWHLSANLWAQTFGEDQFINPWNILHEAYFFIPFQYFDITLGQKLISYGFADIRGPIDVFNSINFKNYSLDEPFDYRRANPMLQVRIYPSFQDTIELSYMPITRPDGERADPFALDDSGDTVKWSTTSYITDVYNSLFVAFKHFGEKWDFQIFYGWYTNHRPDFLIAETDSGTNSIIRSVYRKKHTFGFAYSFKLWLLTLSQDIAFHLTDDIQGTDIGAQDSEFVINTQVLVNLPWNILSQFTVVYAFFPNFNSHKDNGDAADYLAKQVHEFHDQPQQHIAYIIGHFEKTFFREKLKAQLNIGFFFSERIYFGPRITFNITDFWQVETGADIRLFDPVDNIDLIRNDSFDNYYVRLLFRY